MPVDPETQLAKLGQTKKSSGNSKAESIEANTECSLCTRGEVCSEHLFLLCHLAAR